MGKSNIELVKVILEEYKEDKIVFNSVKGLIAANIKNFIEQPVDGILYDLNRSEEVVLTFINDEKWINDYAVCKVIRKLYEKVEKLEKLLEKRTQ